jgi:hypothetical protein
MSKQSNKKIKEQKKTTKIDFLSDLEQTDVWDFHDPGDQRFWEEFFQVEELLEVTDEIDPPTFSITVQNHQTGETKTYSNIHLSAARKKIVC